MAAVIVEWLSVGAWSLLVIISSNAAADLAKERLGKAHRIVVLAGILFSTVAGFSLIIFICERVFGMPEVDLSLGRLTRLFNDFIDSILLPFVGFLSVFSVVILYIWAAITENNKSLAEVLGRHPEATFNVCFLIAAILALLASLWRLSSG